MEPTITTMTTNGWIQPIEEGISATAVQIEINENEKAYAF